MLGRGRPFAIEMSEVADSESVAGVLAQVEEEVRRRSAAKVCVKDLQVVTKRDVADNLKDEETEKRKEYRAVCCCSRPVTHESLQRINESFTPTVLKQETPVRVLHRRPLALRERTIFEMRLQPDSSDPHLLTLSLLTESGTYIKEFVHGDWGHTTPSLRDFLGDECRTDILSLDVQEVFVEWPPTVQRVK